MNHVFNHRRPHLDRKGNLRVPNRKVKTFKVGENLVLTRDVDSSRTGSVMEVANVDQFPFVVMKPVIMSWKGGSIDKSKNQSRFHYVFDMRKDVFVRATKAYIDHLNEHAVNYS
jgi:hypothetical protein